MTDSFVDELLNEVRSGYGFVPLLGSGVSAPSGIPIGVDFGNYIFCYLKKIIDEKAPWNPEDPNWPSLEEVDLSQATPEDKLRAARRWLGAWKTHKSGEAYLEAIGSLADWRAALTFLSRLPERKGSDESFELIAPDDAVVDSAFIHVTRGRQPTLAHMMLAQCADALRIQTILTTNFDTLIEEAFSRQGVHLTTFDVHQRAGLPRAELVLAQRAIVKLHGGRYGLRADYSLDEDPSESDKTTFAKYFSARTTMDIGSSKHLIVMGVSGNDSRTMKLIAHAVRSHGLQVFWVFYRRPSSAAVDKIVDQLQIPREQFHCTAQSDLGLLLLNLYQCHYISLPPPGADYASQLLCPPENYPPERYDIQVLESDVQRLQAMIREGEPRIVVSGSGGVSSVASRVYDDLRRDFGVIWLELDQHADVADFLIALIDGVVQHLGATMVTPPVSRTDVAGCMECLSSLVEGAQRPFLVFANGRDGPGSGAHWDGRVWSKQVQQEFWQEMGTLSRLRRSAIRVVALAGNNGLGMPPKDEEWKPFECKQCLRLDAAAIRLAILQKPPKDWSWQRQRFVFALTLFRKSRYPAALTTWGLIKATKRLSNEEDNDEYRAQKCKEYIEWLYKIGAIRRQPSGMVWMHADIRRDVYDELHKEERIRQEEATCHQGIADWYLKLFRSSNDPHAALESIYHRTRCAESAKIAKIDKNEAKDLEITSILEAVETLELARDRILVGARSTSSKYILEQVLARIDVHRGKEVYQRHRKHSQQLAIVCEDLLCDFARTRGEEVPRRKQRSTPKASRRPSDIRELVITRQDADGLLHQRNYGKCEAEFEKLLTRLGLETNWTTADKDNSKLVMQMRRLGKEWCLSQRSEEEMQLAVRALRGYMFLQMLMSQAAAWKANGKQEGVVSTSGGAVSYLRLRYAESIYTLATSITRYVMDHDFLQVENTYLRTHYGVLLAELKRFKEAHRRLNEATGYLSKSSKAPDGLTWAVIDLRRAETYLYQAQDTMEDVIVDRAHREEMTSGLTDSTDRNRQRGARAYLDDMRYALERAKSRFVNQRKDAWWWTLLLELELSYFNERVRQGRDVDSNATGLSSREIGECAEIVRNGLLIAHSDGVRLARMLNLLQSLGIGKVESDVGDEWQKLHRGAIEINERLKRFTEHPFKDLQRYVQAVQKKWEHEP